MKKLHITTLTTILLLFSFVMHVYAQNTQQNRVLLVELQPGSANSATEEFVELYNDGFSGQNIDGWKIQYKSVNGSSWTTKAELEGDIAPGGRYLIATFSSEENPTQTDLTSGMAQGSGHIRLTDEDEEEIDLLGWGDAAEPLNTAAPSPEKEFSLKRKTNEDGYFYMEDNNFEDWFISEQPSPHGDTWQPAEQTTTQPDDTQSDDSTNTGVTKPKPQTPKPSPNASPSQGAGGTQDKTSAHLSTAKIDITEFLPDPESPQTDADDEFVELYNPNNKPVNLEGYTLESGSEYRYSYTIPKVTIAANAYLALFSIDTNLTLSNNGSQIRLLSPAGLVLSEFVYDESEPGQSWAKKQGGSWVMTTTPTPNAANVFATDDVTSGASSDGSESSQDSVGENAVTLSSGSVQGESTDGSTGSQIDDEESPRSLNSAILAGVGLLAVLYAVYEYRHDIGNRIEQLRRYFKNWRENRRKA